LIEKNNGKITAADLGLIIKGFGQKATEVEIEELIKEIDINHDNCVDFQEFIVMMRAKMHMDRYDDDLWNAWRVFDKSERGKVGVHELREVMLSLGQDFTDEQLHLMIDSIATNGEKDITFEEFKDVAKMA